MTTNNKLPHSLYRQTDIGCFTICKAAALSTGPVLTVCMLTVPYVLYTGIPRVIPFGRMTVSYPCQHDPAAAALLTRPVQEADGGRTAVGVRTTTAITADAASTTLLHTNSVTAATAGAAGQVGSVVLKYEPMCLRVPLPALKRCLVPQCCREVCDRRSATSITFAPAPAASAATAQGTPLHLLHW